MQKIYTLLTSSYSGTVTMHTSAVSFFDRALAEETKAAIESVNGDLWRERKNYSLISRV